MSLDWENKLAIMEERYRNGGLGRREFVKFLCLAGISLGLVGGPFKRQAQADWTIRFDGWGGNTAKALRKYAFIPFHKETDIKVADHELGDPDKFLEQVKSTFKPDGIITGEYNLVHLSGVFDYARYISHGFGVKLNEQRIPNLVNVMPSMIRPLRALSEGALSAVPYNLGQTGIAYNTKRIPPEKAEELGVALLWDEALKGRVATWSNWRCNLWNAALYTKQDPNNIQDVEAVWDALRQQKPLIKRYWKTGKESMSLLAKGVVRATVAWSGRVAALQTKMKNIGFIAPPNCFSWQECIFVVKGSSLHAAQILLNYMLTPECAIAVSKHTKYPPSLDPTRIELPDDIKRLPAFDPTGKLEGYKFADPAYWNSKEAEWAAKWQEIMAG